MGDALSCKSILLKWSHRRLTVLRSAVVLANVDLATHGTVHLAEDADPEGGRTLGVLTKPDLVDRGAEEKEVSFCYD